MSKALEGKIAVVTGGGTGIGRGIALELARAGADVAVASRTIANLEKVAVEVRALGKRAIAVPADVTDRSSVDNMVQRVMEEFGRIDILINNAGGSARERASLFCESTEEVWDYVIALNLKGMRNCTRAVINHMIQQKSGKVISITSLDGMLGSVKRVDYSTAKAGIIGFTRALAKEVAQHHINVNCISAGPIDIGYLDKMPKQSEAVNRWAKRLTDNIGLGRWGKPEDIGTVAVFLASKDADFITGQNYPVCGLSNLNTWW